MNFSDFANTLYPFLGRGKKTHEFVIDLIGQIMEEPYTEDDKQEEIKGDYNPFTKKEPDTLGRIYSGKRNISKRDAGTIIAHANKEKFGEFLSFLPKDATDSLCNNLQNSGIEILDNNVADACANLFFSILEDCAKGIDNAKDYKQCLLGKIEQIDADRVFQSLHEIAMCAQKNNQAANQIRKIFGLDNMEPRIENLIRIFNNIRGVDINEDPLNDIYGILQAVYMYSIETEIYDETLELCQYLNDFIEKSVLDPSSNSPDEIDKLRDEMTSLLYEICDSEGI